MGRLRNCPLLAPGVGTVPRSSCVINVHDVWPHGPRSSTRVKRMRCIPLSCILLVSCASQPDLTAPQVWNYLDKSPQCLSTGLYCSTHTFNDPEDLSKDLKIRWKRQGDGVTAKLGQFQLYMEPQILYGIPGGYHFALYGLEQSDKDRRFNEIRLVGELMQPLK